MTGEAMKRIYVSPAVESCRVLLEGVVALSAGPMKAEVYDWDEENGGSPTTLGDVSSEGGRMYLVW
jgi:hypothetical protein